MEVIYENKLFKVIVNSDSYSVVNKKTNIVEMETKVITQALFQADSTLKVMEDHYSGLVNEK